MFYHLEERAKRRLSCKAVRYDDALRLALGAGQLFDLSQRSEYVEKIVAVAIDEYATWPASGHWFFDVFWLKVKLKGENFELEMKKKAADVLKTRVMLIGDRCSSIFSCQDPVQIDPRLENVVDRMFSRCLEAEPMHLSSSCGPGQGIQAGFGHGTRDEEDRQGLDIGLYRRLL